MSSAVFETPTIKLWWFADYDPYDQQLNKQESDVPPQLRDHFLREIDIMAAPIHNDCYDITVIYNPLFLLLPTYDRYS